MNCQSCEEPFEPKTTWQKFCSEVCRKRVWNKGHCRVCGAQMLCPKCKSNHE